MLQNIQSTGMFFIYFQGITIIKQNISHVYDFLDYISKKKYGLLFKQMLESGIYSTNSLLYISFYFWDII
jgi:hypothetical protein